MPPAAPSFDLYRAKQQYWLGNYPPVADLKLPTPNHADFKQGLFLKARAMVALKRTQQAMQLLAPISNNVAARAISSLARMIEAKTPPQKGTVLEEVRKLSLEIDADNGGDDDKDKLLARVVAGIAFTRCGEFEEALEVLNTETKDIEAIAVISQVYLSLNRPELAQAQLDRSRLWAEDDIPFQLIECAISLVTGKDGYRNALSFYSEMLANPAFVCQHLYASRAVTRIMRNELQEAKADLQEALRINHKDPETLAACIVLGGLGGFRKQETEQFWDELSNVDPNHPLVQDVREKANQFDIAASKFPVPPLAKPDMVPQ